MTQAKFKNFFQKNLENNWAFTNSIYSKFRQDSQYQLESVVD